MSERQRVDLRAIVAETTSWLKRVVTEPRGELNRWERRARFAYDLSRYGVRKLRRDRAPQMAAALAYRTLFGLLPVLVVGTLVIRAIGGFEELRVRLGEFFTSAGLDRLKVSVDSTAGAEAVAEPTLSEWLLRLVDEVQTLDLTAVTWVGIAVLIYSAISLMEEIENSFNHIAHSPGGRPWSRRLPIYWTVLTLGPMALGITSYVGHQLHETLGSIFGFATLWLVMGAVFRWVPNGRLTVRAATSGAFVAAALIHVGVLSLGAYVGGALSVRKLYGSLGIVPLFMLWIYLMWLAVLFGMEVAVAVQRFRGRSPEQGDEESRAPTLVDPTAILVVMGSVAEAFEGGRPRTRREIADNTGVDERAVEILLERLEDAGVIHRLEQGDGPVTLARPAPQLRADYLLQLAFDLSGPAPEPMAAVLDRLRQAQLQAAGNLSLAAIKEE